MCLASSELFSAGTPVGTVIQTRSMATYTSASGARIDTVFSGFVTFTVTQKASLNLTPEISSASTASDSTVVVYPVTIVNSGNGNDDVQFILHSSNGWKVELFLDANNDGILEMSEISAGPLSQLPSLSMDAQLKVILRVHVPRGEELNNVKDTMTFTITSGFSSSTTSTGQYVTTVHTAGMNTTSPGLSVNNPSPAAGQQIIYSFVLTNNGSVPSNTVSVYNMIPGVLSFISGSTTTGALNSASNPVVWNIGTINPGQSITVTLTVQVNSNVNPGTIVSNFFGVNYSVGTNTYSIPTNSTPITVRGTFEYGVELTPMFSALTKDAADTAWYRFKIRNNGAFKEVIELTASSSQHLSWKLYKDGNNNGAWDNTDPQLTNTNDSAGVDIDSLAVGDSVRVFAMAPVPRLEIDQAKDSLQIIATPTGDHSKMDNIWVVTTMNAPVVSINKSVFPIGNQLAGSIITYTISYANTGSVAVKNFSIVDTTPSVTNYMANSVKVNGIAVTDNTGGVSIAVNGENNTVITFAVGTLSSKSNGSLEFTVKIK